MKKELFIQTVSFEWDEEKNKANIEKHGYSFVDAAKALCGSCLVTLSNRNDEIRYLAIGMALDRLIAVIYTERHDKIRIISARRARKKEEDEYRELYG